MMTIETPPAQSRRSIQVKTILAPLDFSSYSLRALKDAALFADKFDATLHLAHVQHHTVTTAIEAAGDLLLDYTDAIALLQDHLAESQERNEVKFSANHCHVMSGRPFEKICAIAREIGADLIMMPTRGRSAVRQILLGSTAERVIRFAPCPVLITRKKTYKAGSRHARKSSRLSIDNILLPVDFSDCSLAGVEYGVFLARKFNARLRLFHTVYPYPNPGCPERASASVFPVIETAHLVARKQLKQLRKAHIPGSIPCETEARVGHAVSEICSESVAPRVDLIVMSTHGRTGLRHALIGSVAEHVARYARCSVLVVPSNWPKKYEYETFALD